MSRRVLFISNGVGEDLIASRVIASLPGPGATVTAYPLVGLGAYPPHIPVLAPRQQLPSGGFSLRKGLRGLSADLAAGLIGLWLAQRRTLAAQRGRHDLVVAVGDVYCLWMAGLASPHPVFVATADSVRITPFGSNARWVLRRHARRVFARDPETAEALRAMGLQAEAAGNVMMDLLESSGQTFGLPPSTPVVALLPGSRREALDNAVLLAQAAALIADQMPEVRFLLALAPTVSAARIGLRLRALDAASAMDARAAAEDGALVQVGRARVLLTSAFADALMRAAVVIGLAGTANEQAAGLARPVVAFPGPGAQFGPDFMADQRRLLSEALVTTRDWRDAAGAVVRLLRNPSERRRRGAIGRERMGPPGGAQRIADALAAIA